LAGDPKKIPTPKGSLEIPQSGTIVVVLNQAVTTASSNNKGGLFNEINILGHHAGSAEPIYADGTSGDI
jgi:hypothetical protein